MLKLTNTNKRNSAIQTSFIVFYYLFIKPNVKEKRASWKKAEAKYRIPMGRKLIHLPGGVDANECRDTGQDLMYFLFMKKKNPAVENEHLSYSVFFPVKITKGSQKSFHKKTNY